MDIKTLIKDRRTIHDFDPQRSIADIDIKAVIETACWAPNHHLTEPWHFYLLGEETIESVCQLNREIMTGKKGSEIAEQKYIRWKNIPGWIIVTCDKSGDELQFMEDYAACACAMQNMMLTLWADGVGAKWSTGGITRNERFYELAWIDPALEKIIGIFWYGYPAEIPQTVRQPVDKVITNLP